MPKKQDAPLKAGQLASKKPLITYGTQKNTNVTNG